eukprot:gnl/TRDRNA2_/TRDRNA2_96253_c1_seq1.p1 gnl/TRDRNA2_/TRDRNA2_96253_c1~~gnl/TRDRNA2_/TRDRNA2_96253_c1_seq1.p1  ORF type:complete len:555 (+),score=97.75 gnl/TRDRNA2_/TRDRNA2_96253_c1_seq1:107-1666(+)
MEQTRLNSEKIHAIHFLREHNVSLHTQLQVLFNIEQTGRAKALQRSCNRLLSRDLPQELQMRVREELWSTRLMSLELISFLGKMHDSFIRELTQLVSEDWFPFNATLFRKGDAALMCYQIIKGRVAIATTQTEQSRHAGSKSAIPDFTDGMWVGEKALVNRSFVRSATAVAKSMLQLMGVPADGFHKLIIKFELRAEFECMCKDTVWRGLCGRCGVLGTHFSDKCPLIKGHHARATGKIHDDLRMFLEAKGLEWLAPTLLTMRVRDLTALQKMDLEHLRRLLAQSWTADLQHSLSAEHIDIFRRVKSQKMQDVLDHDVSRLGHFIFLSHYKVEAGTEAALMRSELMALISTDPDSPAHKFDVPFFLDSEDLFDINYLTEQVHNSYNVLLLLTPEVLTRPWCLVELVEARRANANILPIQILKKGTEFQFPDETFYQRLRDGSLMSAADTAILQNVNISVEEIETTLRDVFSRIAGRFSPHESMKVRKGELMHIMDKCQLHAPLRQAQKHFSLPTTFFHE